MKFLSSSILTCQSRARESVVVMLSNALSVEPALSQRDWILATEEDESSSSIPLCSPTQPALLDQFNWLKSLCICFYSSLCLLYPFHFLLNLTFFLFFCWSNWTMTMLLALVNPVPAKQYLLVGNIIKIRGRELRVSSQSSFCWSEMHPFFFSKPQKLVWHG